jgi:hypothetical protein
MTIGGRFLSVVQRGNLHPNLSCSSHSQTAENVVISVHNGDNCHFEQLDSFHLIDLEPVRTFDDQ